MFKNYLKLVFILIILIKFLISCGTELNLNEITYQKKINQKKQIISQYLNPHLKSIGGTKYHNDDSYGISNTTENKHSSLTSKKSKTSNLNTTTLQKSKDKYIPNQTKILKPKINISSLPPASKPLGSGGFAPKPLGPDTIY